MFRLHMSMKTISVCVHTKYFILLISSFNSSIKDWQYRETITQKTYTLFITAGIAVTLFFGGWMPLHIAGLEGFNAVMDYIPGVIWFVGKTFFVVFLLMWIRWTFPRLRIDQVLVLKWKYLMPLSLLVLMIIIPERHRAMLYHGYRLFRRDTYCRRTVACIYSVELPVAAVRWVAAHRHGYNARPGIGNDACGDFYSLTDGSYLLFRIYERGTRISEILCVSVAVHILNVRPRSGYKHFPDVCFLRTCGSIVLSSDRLLLHQTWVCRSF